MFRLRFILLGIFISAGLLFAADGDVHSFELKWQQNGESSRIFQPFDRDVPFDKEPELGSNEIYRGVLGYRGQTSEKGLVSVLSGTSPGVNCMWT